MTRALLIFVLAALVLSVALVGAVAQLVRGERPALLPRRLAAAS